MQHRRRSTRAVFMPVAFMSTVAPSSRAVLVNRFRILCRSPRRSCCFNLCVASLCVQRPGFQGSPLATWFVLCSICMAWCFMLFKFMTGQSSPALQGGRALPRQIRPTLPPSDFALPLRWSVSLGLEVTGPPAPKEVHSCHLQCRQRRSLARHTAS